MIPHKIFLIGLPGSGKSHFGKTLADDLGVALIDLDAYIEAEVGQTISSFFAEKGEILFREIESKCLQEIINNEQKAIIATGGGTPCFHNGIDLMLKSGFVIHLEVENPVLAKRLEKSDERPLVQQNVVKTILDLRSKRDRIYKKAHLTLLDRDIDKLKEKIF